MHIPSCSNLYQPPRESSLFLSRTKVTLRQPVISTTGTKVTIKCVTEVKMPTRYIGRDPIFKGKSLYEIARQLRDLGVGRVVYRQSQALRWHGQKTYFRLTKVVPDATCPEFTAGSAWGEEVFRGKNRGLSEITTGHKYDWVLVPKDEEEAFCTETEVFEIDPSSIPKNIDCPPLLEMVIKKDLKAVDQPVPDKIQLPFLSENYIKDLEWKWKS